MTANPDFPSGPGTRLAAYAAAADFEKLPGEVRAKLIDHVVDTIGVMFAGLDVDDCVRARKAASLWGNADEATVAGLPNRYPAPTAAFLNALNGRIYTFDDTYEPGTMHPGSPVIGAALAMAERAHVDGKTFLSAVFAGYETATRVARAVSPGHYAAGFHNTGTCTVFGAAAAAARILGLSGLATAEALGLAGATAAGLRQHQLDGSMLDSAFHGARAAQSGVMVAQLRAEGVSGPPGILDGPMGFCAVMAPKSDIALLDAGLGERYEFLQMTIKPFPNCRFVHGPVQAALDLRSELGIDSTQIENIEIATFHQSIEVSDRPQINSAFDVTVSHQYAISLALAKGALPISAFSGEAGVDEAARQLMKKVSVIHDPALEVLFPKSWPHRVTIRMKNGAEHMRLSEFPPGRVTPIPQNIVDQKFIDHSAPVLGQSRGMHALDAIRKVASCRDMAELGRVLRPQD